MIIRTSNQYECSFTLLRDKMIERDPFRPFFLLREDLKDVLEQGLPNHVAYQMTESLLKSVFMGRVIEGTTQRGKKFIQIGCKRFVGVNRTRLIRWAKQ